MLRVGLTGGIGAGKSTASARLAEHGALVVDADAIAREVVEPGTAGLAELVSRFGEDILQADGTLNRAALAAHAFRDDESRRALNGILHPRIGARTEEIIGSAAPDAIVVQDIPLLVEGGLAPAFHLVIIVHAAEDVRLARLTGTRGMDEADARARIRAQARDEQRRAVADVWLDNSGRPEDLARRVDDLWRDRLVPFERNVRERRPVPAPTESVGASSRWGDEATRLIARLRFVGGELVSSAEHVGRTADGSASARDDIEVLLTVADEEAASQLGERLEQAGFPADERPAVAAGSGLVRRHRGCDPGRPVAVNVRIGARAEPVTSK